MSEEVELSAEYKGWQITHRGDDYFAEKDGVHIRKNAIAKVQRAIDKALRLTKTDGFKRTTAYESPTYSKGTITSITDIRETYTGLPVVEVAFSYAEPGPGHATRTRTSIRNLVRDSPFNRELVEKIVELKRDVEGMEKRLDFFKPEDVLKEEAE